MTFYAPHSPTGLLLSRVAAMSKVGGCPGVMGGGGESYQPRPVPLPQQGAAQDRGHQGQPQTQVLGTSMRMGTGQGWAGCGPTRGPAWQGPWLGRAGMWGAGDGPSCKAAGTGADSPGGQHGVLSHGQCWGWPERGEVVSALRALMLCAESSQTPRAV